MYNPKFSGSDMNTWTASNVRKHLKSGTMSEEFYRKVFGWSNANLHEAVDRANQALRDAGVPLREPLVPIRCEKGTTKPTPGAAKRINAELDLIGGEYNSDGLFDMPHQAARDSRRPAWFVDEMMPGGRERIDQCDYPTITQKFLQFSRDKLKASVKASVEEIDDDEDEKREGEETQPSLESPRKARKTSESNKSISNQRASSLQDLLPHRDGGDSSAAKDPISILPRKFRLPLDEVEVHVGWIVMSEDGRFVLEKDFRSMRTWLASADQWRYDYEEMRSSLRIAKDSKSSVYWFEDHAHDPWVAKDNHAIAGAIERMHRKGAVCLFVAAELGHVRALSKKQRSKLPQSPKPDILTD